MRNFDIRKERREQNLTLAVLSALSGVDISALSRAEVAGYRLSDENLARIARALKDVADVREKYRGVPLDLNAVRWLQREIRELHTSTQRRAVAAAGSAE